jgi:hypothetical protein
LRCARGSRKRARRRCIARVAIRSWTTTSRHRPTGG